MPIGRMVRHGRDRGRSRRVGVWGRSHRGWLDEMGISVWIRVPVAVGRLHTLWDHWHGLMLHVELVRSGPSLALTLMHWRHIVHWRHLWRTVDLWWRHLTPLVLIPLGLLIGIHRVHTSHWHVIAVLHRVEARPLGRVAIVLIGILTHLSLRRYPIL